MKKMKTLATLALAFAMTAPAVACVDGNDPTPNVVPDPDNLAVYSVDMGYGVEWLKACLAEFEKQDWVKEKYPALTTTLVTNSLESFAPNKIEAGKGANPYDLLFSSYLTKYKNKAQYVTDLTDVYQSKVPGEDILYKDKVVETYKNFNKTYYDADETETSGVWWSVPWANGFEGLLYNPELLTELGYQLPVTTDEFIALCKTITARNDSKYNKGYAIASSFEGNDYWAYWFPTLWAQYDGFDGYMNFYQGIDSFNRYSNKIFQNKGRLYALEVLEQTYSFENGFVNPEAYELGFMTGQLGFLKGDGLFMPNGTWFSNEMENLKSQAIAAGQKVYTIDVMPVPVVSKIIEKTPSINDDATLQAVIRAIDAGETSYAGVDAADFETVKAARQLTGAECAVNHNAVIPTIADSKEAAKDFLLFMATDKAIELYAEATNGCSAPFNYDMEAKNPTLFASFDKMQQSRMTLMKTYKVLPSSNNFALAADGGVKPLRLEVSSLYATFSVKNHVKTPQKLFDETIEYWTETRFAEALSKAGIA